MGKGSSKKQLREKVRKFYTGLTAKKRKEVNPKAYVDEEFKMKPKKGKA